MGKGIDKCSERRAVVAGGCLSLAIALGLLAVAVALALLDVIVGKI